MFTKDLFKNHYYMKNKYFFEKNKLLKRKIVAKNCSKKVKNNNKNAILFHTID